MKLRTFEEIEKNIVEYRVVRSAGGSVNILFSSNNKEEAKNFFDKEINYGDLHIIEINELQKIYKDTVDIIKLIEENREYGLNYNLYLEDKSNIERYLENKDLKKYNRIQYVNSKDINLELIKNMTSSDEELEVIYKNGEIIIRQKMPAVLQYDKFKKVCMEKL